MTKYHYYLILASILLLSSCQSIEQLSIDYMIPGEISFPATLKRVAVVNNMPEIPDNKLIIKEEDQKKTENELARISSYYNGNAAITTESLAESLADGNYFDEVIICDSALRKKDVLPRETTLTEEEVNKLVRDLNVDFLIALENIQISAIRKISYLPDFNAYYGTVDAKVYPTIRLYLPGRKGPMATINSNDSIFWEETGTGEAYVRSRLIKQTDLIQQASEFAGAVPVKQLLPYWHTAYRNFFAGGSVNMRDAAVYAKEENWAEAVKLWKKNYETSKGKLRMYSAYNAALGYEMQDNLEEAVKWAEKAQALARQIDKVDEIPANKLTAEGVPNYLFTSLYLTELQKRKEDMGRLNAQMKRFGDDF